MKTILKVLSFDLGSNLGWAYCTCDIPKRKLLVNDYGTIDINQKLNKSNLIHQGSPVSKQQARLKVFEDTVEKLTNKLIFDAYATEDVFFQRNRVASYRSLLLYLTFLERIVNINRGKPLFKLAPTAIKKAIVTGTADKLAVQMAILNHSQISFKHEEYGSQDIILDEHSADSIAVSYAFMVNTLNFSI